MKLKIALLLQILFIVGLGQFFQTEIVISAEKKSDQPVAPKEYASRHPSGIKGQDDRRRVDISAYPWRTIGRLNNNGSFCTGVLVGEYQVLTAAHCFWNRRTRRWSSASVYHFVVGYEKGTYTAHAKGVSYKMAFAQLPDLSKVPLQRSDDWAILTLDKPLGRQFGTVRLTDSPGRSFISRGGKDKQNGKREIIQAGYSRDFAHVLTVHENCTLTDYVRLAKTEDPVYFHQCDATRGDSGSPIFYVDKGEYALLAIHSATAKRPTGEVIGIAVPNQQYHRFLQN